MKLISAFVFATRIVQFLFYLNLKFQDSSSLLRRYRSVCVGPVRISHETTHLANSKTSPASIIFFLSFQLDSFTQFRHVGILLPYELKLSLDLFLQIFYFKFLDLKFLREFSFKDMYKVKSNSHAPKIHTCKYTPVC